MSAIQELLLHCRGDDVPMSSGQYHSSDSTKDEFHQQQQQHQLDHKLHHTMMVDQSSVVRLTLMQSVLRWVREWNEFYSFKNHLYLLVAIGMVDEVQSVRECAEQCMRDCGVKYVEENEKDVQEMREYERMMPVVDSSNRSPLECRMVIRETGHLKKNLPRALSDLFDWNVSKRRKACRVLNLFIIYAEDHITQHLSLLVPNYFQVPTEEEEMSIREECLTNAVRNTGRFVTPESYLPLICAHLKSQYASSPRLLSNVLIVLRELLIGARDRRSDSGDNEAMFLVKLCEELSQNHLVYTNSTTDDSSSSVELRGRVLDVILSVIDSFSNAVHANGDITFAYLKLIILTSCDRGGNNSNNSGSSGSDTESTSLSDRGWQLVDLLSRNEMDRLLIVHFDRLLNQYTSDVNVWDQTSVNMYAFLYLMKRVPRVAIWNDIASDHSMLTLLFVDKLSSIDVGHPKSTSRPSPATLQKFQTDAIVSIQLFGALNQFLATMSGSNDSDNSEPIAVAFVDQVLSRVIGPHLIWRNGRFATETRRLAVACMDCLLKQNKVSGKQAWPHALHMMSAMEEDSDSIRVMVSRCMQDYIKITYEHFDEEAWDTLIKILTDKKGLNDDVEAVRISTARLLFNVVQCVTSKNRTDLVRTVITSLFIHLDDEKEAVRNAIYETIMSYVDWLYGASGHRMLSEVENIFNKFERKYVRAEPLPNRLRNHLNTLMSSSSSSSNTDT